ncbi:MAG: hypothetical protein WBO57_08290 [Gammaproteobacteria bacterium]
MVTRIAIAVGILNLLVPIGIFVYADVADKDYRYLFWDADTTANWFSSIQLTLIAIAAYINFEMAGLIKKLDESRSRRPWIWLVIAFGFIFLACDEQFELHDLLSEDVLEPSRLFSWVPYIQDGDVVLYFYMATGLVFAFYLLDELRRVRPSLLYFSLAVVLAMATIIVDSLGWPVVKNWPLQGFWTSAFEEIGELWAQYLFLLSFLIMLKKRLGLLADMRV